MTELFSAWKFEALVNGAWTDISPDVLHTPEPTATGMGIQGVLFTDRVGDLGALRFSLDNSNGNSAGLEGYYTPDRSTTRAGFSTPLGLPIHVYFEWDGIRRYKYYGLIDSYKVQPFTSGLRRVDVTCSNWMKAAADHQLNLLGYQLNKRFDEGIQLVMANMARQPQGYTLREGNNTFPTLFDVTRTTTKALGEIEKLVFSEMGRAYITGDGTGGENLTLEHRLYRSEYIDAHGLFGKFLPKKSTDTTSTLLLEAGGSLLLEAGGHLLLSETQEADYSDSNFIAFVPTYGEGMANRAIFKTYPRDVDAAAATVLWSAEKRIEFAAGEEKLDVRGSFRDPDNPDTKINGIELVTPVASTDYTATANEDGTGTDYTSSLSVVADLNGTAEVKYTSIKNNAGVTVYVYLQQRGKGVRVYATNEKVYDDVASQQATKQIVTLTIDMPYLNAISDMLFVEELGAVWSTFLLGVSQPNVVAGSRIKSLTINANQNSLTMAGFMCLEPGEPTMLFETETDPGIGTTLYRTNPWFVQGYDWTLRGGKYIDWTVYVVPAGVAQ